jgi:hypothetical protein
MLHFKPVRSFWINKTIVLALFNKSERPIVARIPLYDMTQVAESVSLNSGADDRGIRIIFQAREGDSASTPDLGLSLQFVPGALPPGINGRGPKADLSGQLQFMSRLKMHQIIRACYGVLLIKHREIFIVYLYLYISVGVFSCTGL